MQINGWLRLWIMATVAWLCVVIFYSWQMWPRPEAIAHTRDFLSHVQPQSALLQCARTISTEECEKSASLIAIMPNGYRLLLSIPDTNPVSEAAAKSYWQAVKLENRIEINKFVLLAVIAWLGPSLGVLLFGIGSVWVSLGFRLPTNRNQ